MLRKKRKKESISQVQHFLSPHVFLVHFPSGFAVVSKVSFENPRRRPLRQRKHRGGSRSAHAWPKRRTPGWRGVGRGVEPRQPVQDQALQPTDCDLGKVTSPNEIPSPGRLMHGSLHQCLLSSHCGPGTVSEQRGAKGAEVSALVGLTS